MSDVVRRAALVAGLAGALALAAVAAPRKPAIAAPVLGEWVGTYVCAQGRTALRLNVWPEPDGSLGARFSFGPTIANWTIPRGSYTMSGTVDAKTRRVILRAEEWTSRPFGYVTVDLDGTVTPDGDWFTGRVTDPSCRDFVLRRAPARVS